MKPANANRLKSIALFSATFILIGMPMYELVFGDWIIPDNINKLNIIRDRTVTYTIGNLYETPHKTATYTRDAFGLRGQFEDPSQVVILTVGGSSTDQRYITDGETWQDVLQQEFEYAGKPIAVANAGVDGHSTFGHIKSFDDWFSKTPGLQPGYILFFIGLNDFHVDENYGNDALLQEGADRSLGQLVREKSAIYHMARVAKALFEAEVLHNIGHHATDFKKRQWTSEPLQASYEGIMSARLAAYEKRVEALVEKTESFGSMPIFVTQPSRRYRFVNGVLEGAETSTYGGVPINGVDYYYMTRKLDEITCSVAQEHGSMCLDLAHDMASAWEDGDFYDNSHMTPAGAKKVGEYLFEKLHDKL